jgi:hypothetical protein
MDGVRRGPVIRSCIPLKFPAYPNTVQIYHMNVESLDVPVLTGLVTVGQGSTPTDPDLFVLSNEIYNTRGIIVTGLH